MAQIVALSDYVRMKYIYQNGGIWIDADTIVLSDIRKSLDIPEGKLLWHSEQLFGAVQGNVLLEEASRNMLSAEKQTWGNPGNIKGIVEKNVDRVKAIRNELIDPGYRPSYGFKTRDIMLDTEIDVRSFIANKNVSIIKMYNSEFAATSIGRMEMEEFVNSDTLASKIWKYIDGDMDGWIVECRQLIAESGGVVTDGD